MTLEDKARIQRIAINAHKCSLEAIAFGVPVEALSGGFESEVLWLISLVESLDAEQQSRSE